MDNSTFSPTGSLLTRGGDQREGVRSYLQGLLLPAERHKTLAGLVNTEPVVGAQQPRAQNRNGFFLSRPGTGGRCKRSGDRKDGQKTAHVGRQYLANLGKIDNGVVSATSLWADEGVCYPIDFEPYTPAHHFEKGKEDTQFRTKIKLAVELVGRAVQAQIPFRPVVADPFYGEDPGVRRGLQDLGVGYVLALKPSHEWWHPIRAIGSFQEAAGWEVEEF